MNWSQFSSEFEGEDRKEVAKLMQAIGLLMDGCTQNLRVDQLKVIQKRIKEAIDQCLFWKKQNNSERFIYDLREFGIWLADFITEAEEKFWEEQ